MNDDGHDDLDRELRAAGSRWRERQRPASGVDLATLAGPARARWVAPVAAAAAVAAIVGGGAVLLGGGDGDAEPAPGASSTTERSDVRAIVVPWVDLPAAHEEVPVPAPVWDPAPDYAADEPTCSKLQVRLDARFALDEGVIPYGELELFAWNGARCSFPTNASVGLAGSEGQDELWATPAHGQSGWPGTAVLLDGDASAYANLSWRGGDCTEPDNRAETIRVGWDGGQVAAVLPEGFRPCLSEDIGLGLDQPVTTLSATEVTPPSPYDTLQIDQVGYEPAGQDGLETWLIQLTATGEELQLGDCPDARVTHSYTDDAGALRDERHRYRMNCDWAGMAHDSEGDPVLPVDQPVVFTVKAPAPSPGSGEQLFESTWTLLGPQPDGRVLERTIDQTQAPELPAIVPEEEADYHLQISNQAFENEEVPIRVLIDGVTLIDDVFAVEGQHTWTDYHLALAPGEHQLEAVSDDGGSFSTTITADSGVDTYGQLLFWQERGEPEFTWSEQDHAFLWD